MQKEKDLRGVGIAFRKGEQVEIVMSDVEVLSKPCATHKSKQLVPPNSFQLRLVAMREYTFIPSSEKQGGTAELSSSASDRRTGNFSTADMGMSPL